MKCVRILVLLWASGLGAVFSVPATAQFEIDPDHFDQMGTAKAHGLAKNQAAPRTTQTKRPQKHSQQANKHPAGTRQAKAGNQPLSDRSKGE
jgi:hypothetical protein